MKITAKSVFHTDLTHTWQGIKPGINFIRLRGRRGGYCLDYSNNKSHVCGCGYPVDRTDWTASDGDAEVVCHGECGADGNFYGRGYLKIEVIS